MSLQIISSTDEITVDTIVLLIYGQPDAGKTSTAFTAKNTLLIDCDRGAHRSRYRQSCIQPKSWREIANLSRQPELGSFDTIAVDTVGRLLEMITSDILSGDGTSYGSNGILNLRGYGELKARFIGWLTPLRDLGKDIVLIAHHKESVQQEKIGNRYETKRFLRPDITGGSYEEVMKVCDAVGYLHREGNQRVITFDATSERAGKNAARINYHAIPDFEGNKTYLAGIINLIKESLSGIGREERETMVEVNEFSDRLDAAIAKAAESNEVISVAVINQFLAEATCIERPVSKAQCLKLVGNLARQCKFGWDDKQKVFIVKEEANESGNAGVSEDAATGEDQSEQSV